MKKKFLTILAATMLVMTGCSSDDDDKIVDTEYPEIIQENNNSFPLQCSVIQKGQKLIFTTVFRDNVELGSYSLDVHHNFDHHTHTTEVEECNLQPKKTPVKPFNFIKSYDIPVGLKEYHATKEIDIPADIDPGDYHFMIRVTDKEGWQTLKGLSIKIE